MHCTRTGALIAVFVLCLCGGLWGFGAAAEPTRSEAACTLAAYGEAVRPATEAQGIGSPDMSVGVKTAQSRCPPGQLVFLTNACGCNGACCACSAQAPYLDHCSCQCSPTPPTTCNRGFSAGRR